MGTVVADLIARFRMDGGEFARGAQQVSRQADSLSKRFGGLGTALKGAFAGVAVKQILDVGTAMFKLGIQSEAWERRFTTVFGDAAESVRAWSDEVNEKFGMSDERLRGVASSLGDLLVPMGFTRQAAADMSVEMMNVANALSQWVGGARSAEEAAHIMARGILGERESLKELGVSILETDVQARMLAMGMGELTGQAREQARAQATWALIQEKSADAIAAYEGGLSDGAEAAANMASAIDEMKVAVGELVVKLAPAVTLMANLVRFATDFLTLNWRGVSGFVEEFLMAPMPTPGNAFSVRGAMGGWQQQIAAQEQSIANQRRLIELLNKQRVLRGLHGGTPAPLTPTGAAASQMWGGQDPAVFFRQLAIPDGLRKQIAASLADPFKQGRREIMLQLRATRIDVGNFFQELPDAASGFSFADLLANQQQQTELENRISNMLGTAGALGLDNLVSNMQELSAAEWQALFDMGLTIAEIIQLGVAAGDVHVPVSGHYDYNTGTWVTGKAAGGPVSAMAPYLVGERGPELFVPNRGGTIVPNSQLGAGSTVVNVHVAGSVIAEHELARLLEDQLMRTVQRGGSSTVIG